MHILFLQQFFMVNWRIWRLWSKPKVSTSPSLSNGEKGKKEIQGTEEIAKCV
jgi:hypothetical protein